jgi:hypothetical protein
MAFSLNKFDTLNIPHAINVGTFNSFIERALLSPKSQKKRPVQLDKFNMLLLILPRLESALEGLKR